jgi:hypothetical protein
MRLVGGLLFFTLGQDKSSYMTFYNGCLSHKGCVCMSVGFSSVFCFFCKNCLLYVMYVLLMSLEGFKEGTVLGFT